MPSPDEPPIISTDGSAITMGPISKDLVPLLTRWMNEFGTQLRLGFPLARPMPREAEERWYDAEIEATDRVLFVIREKASGSPIGTTGLHEIDLRNRSAVFGIAIGEPSARGKGYGTEATHLTLDYGFSILGLHSVRLGVFEYNIAGQRAYERAGFKECGRYREHIWMYGRYWDEIHMDILASEFTSPVLAKAHGPDQSR